MRLDRFTVKSQEGLTEADALARRRDHQEVTTLHLLAALLDQENGLIPPLLERAVANLSQLRHRLDAALGRLPKVRGADTFFGRGLKDMFDEAVAEAERLKDKYVSAYVLDVDDVREAEQRVLDALRATFRPHFLNRVDATVVFKRLDVRRIREIVDIQMRNVDRLVAQREKIIAREINPGQQILVDHGRRGLTINTVPKQEPVGALQGGLSAATKHSRRLISAIRHEQQQGGHDEPDADGAFSRARRNDRAFCTLDRSAAGRARQR